MNEDKKSYGKIDFIKKPHVMVVEARFYEDIADMLFAGAKAVFDMNGATYERFTVPGALEIPAAVEMGVQSGRFDAYLALGCVIRGETSHYDIVAGESSRGLMNISTGHGIALGNGILTVESRPQAEARANPAEMDKGGGAAQAALEMAALKERVNAGSGR
ncbi:MAG: 6,7-dimethyl-8-ribityllumazine synthase [Micavibrio sp.]